MPTPIPLLGFPNLTPRAAAITGGTWTAAQPLDMLRRPQLAYKALSASADPAATRFVIDLGSPRTVKMARLVNHNGALGGFWRLDASNNADLSAPLYDSADQPLFPPSFAGDVLEWEDPAWWSGAYVDADLPPPMRDSLIVLSAPVTARYWRVRVTTDQPFWLSTLFLSAAWEMPGLALGAEFGPESRTQIDQALGGAEYFDYLAARDAIRVTVPHMPNDVAWQRAWELIKQADVFGQIHFVPRPYDPLNAVRGSMVGRLRTLSPIVAATYRRYSAAFDLVRIMG